MSGKRVAKNLIDTSSVLLAGAAGGVVGAVVGGIAGPVGTITGGFLGSVAASAACSALVDKLTQSFFGIPKDIAILDSDSNRIMNLDYEFGFWILNQESGFEFGIRIKNPVLNSDFGF
uniref:Glycine zipper domain-containing protein n=1 Tax=Acrobeloides nanus TaxID=290746 RepID=A0A914CPK9_9BILA